MHASAVGALEPVLYESFYCLGAAEPRREQQRGDPPPADRAFVTALSAANAGRGSWSHGWQCEGRSGDDLLVRGHGLRLVVKPAQARLDGGDARIGAPVQIRLPKERPYASPGYYTALGDADLLAEGGRRRIRLYFHVAPSGAPDLVARLTSSLNELGVAFRLKVVDAPARYSRCDSAVLGIAASDFEVVRPLLRTLPSSRVSLRVRTPAFTKVLGRGIGLAEQPASGESFGTERCRLLADAIITAHDRGSVRVHERMDVVAECFASRGLDIEAPYLEPLSQDRYAMSSTTLR